MVIRNYYYDIFGKIVTKLSILDAIQFNNESNSDFFYKHFTGRVSLICCERFNDVPLVYDETIYNKLKSADIDHQMAQHVAHLFIRDTVSLFNEKVHQDDTVEMDHFEVCLFHHVYNPYSAVIHWVFFFL